MTEVAVGGVDERNRYRTEEGEVGDVSTSERLCKCGNPTPMGRPNRFGVRMPTSWCGHCPPPRDRYDQRYRSTVVLGPASCQGCGELVWFDRLGLRWLDADRRGHRCGLVKVA